MSINYELARELKDAGFPQTGERPWLCGGHYYHDPEPHLEKCSEIEPIVRDDHYCESASMVAENYAEVPTLEELIDACRELNHDFSFDFEVSRDGDFWAEAREFGQLLQQVRASTLPEAVARLWLALNKKV